MGLFSRNKTEKRAAINSSTGYYNSVMNFFSNMVSVTNSSGQQVDQITSLKLSAFYSSVRNISEDIAKIPFGVWQLDSNGNKKYVIHPATTLLNKKPSSISTPFTFKQTLIQYALISGNGYAYIERDKNAKPIALYILQNYSVNPYVKDNVLYYIVTDISTGLTGTFNQDEIFHLRGMGDGYVGKSVVSYGAESIGKALATQSYASGFFGNGATMSGVMQIPGIVQDENVLKKIKNNFISSFKEMVNGKATANGIAILQGGATFQKISVSPNEAQFIESQDFNVADVCRWFRMPLSKVQAGSTGSSNLEQLNIEYVTDCLMPWVVKFEQEVERKLFREDEMDMFDAKFTVAMLMRGDSTATSNYLKTLFYTGAINRNDIRRFLDMNTIAEDYGNTYYSPVNMIPAQNEKAFWDGKKGTDNQASQAGADATGSGAN